MRVRLGPPNTQGTFDGALEGFKKGCWPFIGLDGKFLKSQFKGQLLTTVALDGNNQLFPLVMAYVEKEKQESWTFFLEHLMMELKEDNFTLMSNRQKGLRELVAKVFLMSQH